MISFEALNKIQAVVLDIDGVMTDGRIGYGCGSDIEIKYFNVKDGHGIRMGLRAGLKIGVLSGRHSVTNEFRARDLNLSFFYHGIKNKKEGFLNLLKEQNLTADSCMYIGDDLVDYMPMKLAGFAVAVANAAAELDEVCDYRTRHSGGDGAVREALEYLLKGQRKWDFLVERYRN